MMRPSYKVVSKFMAPNNCIIVKFDCTVLYYHYYVIVTYKWKREAGQQVS